MEKSPPQSRAVSWSTVRGRWGGAAEAGFVAIPSILLKHQGRLGLSDQELVTLLHVISYWWLYDNQPFPSSNTLAKRMGKNERSVQRSIRSLRKKNYVDTQVREDGRRTIDVSPIQKILIRMAEIDPFVLSGEGVSRGAVAQTDRALADTPAVVHTDIAWRRGDECSSPSSTPIPDDLPY